MFLQVWVCVDCIWVSVREWLSSVDNMGVSGCESDYSLCGFQGVCVSF